VLRLTNYIRRQALRIEATLGRCLHFIQGDGGLKSVTTRQLNFQLVSECRQLPILEYRGTQDWRTPVQINSPCIGLFQLLYRPISPALADCRPPKSDSERKFSLSDLLTIWSLGLPPCINSCHYSGLHQTEFLPPTSLPSSRPSSRSDTSRL